jgi:hypothetical protein
MSDLHSGFIIAAYAVAAGTIAAKSDVWRWTSVV